MRRRPRTKYTETQKALMWERWKKGETLHQIGRNGGASCYRAAQADQAAWQRAHRPKQCKLAQSATLARLVKHRLQSQWSPEQIAGWLKHTYPGDESLQVSHEAIYRSLFIQARGALKKELLEHLRRTRGMRRSRHQTQKTEVHGQIPDAVSISERPASVEDRAVPGHREGDLRLRRWWSDRHAT